jgi:DNA invertase Pin-like site-specific DNA recombinase
MTKKTAVAYYRTSSAANVGDDKDILKRQRSAVEAYAARERIEIVGAYNDAAVSGTDAIEARPGFVEMLARIEGNGVKTILVETANRFARDLVVAETGWRFLQAKGVDLIAVDSPEAFLSDTPTAVMIRQILGAVSQFEKASLVAKLRGARERKKRLTGKCEGNPGHAAKRPEVVALARALRRKRRGERASLRDIAAELAARGHTAEGGKPFSSSVIARMVEAARP